MLMSSPRSPVLPESPLDVLSRAASMVESASSEESDATPSPPQATAIPRSNSFKDLHPKFRRHGASEYLSMAETVRTQKLGRQTSLPSTKESVSPPVSPPSYPGPPVPLESPEAPLDFSIRKRSSSPLQPPPYKYTNPLRQHSPPTTARSSQSPPPPTHLPHHLPVNPAPAYYRPPPYPRTPSPPPPPPCRPPPPSYEAAIAAKPVSPLVPTTSPTFITLHPRPSPGRTADYSPPAKDLRPSVITSARRDKEQEDKENKGHKREMTIVEESGACDLMEEHFRKSLGADYSKLFKEKPEKVKREASEPKESLDNMDVDDAKAFKDDIDMSGYTVEDHFAKALGATWTKLQAEAEKKEKKLTSSSSHLLSSSSSHHLTSSSSPASSVPPKESKPQQLIAL